MKWVDVFVTLLRKMSFTCFGNEDKWRQWDFTHADKFWSDLISSDLILSRSESNESWSTLRSSDLNQMIREPTPKFWSESKGLRYALWNSNLNQKIHEPDPKFWFKSNDSWSTLHSPTFHSFCTYWDREHGNGFHWLRNIFICWGGNILY